MSEFQITLVKRCRQKYGIYILCKAFLEKKKQQLIYIFVKLNCNTTSISCLNTELLQTHMSCVSNKVSITNNHLSPSLSFAARHTSIIYQKIACLIVHVNKIVTRYRRFWTQCHRSALVYNIGNKCQRQFGSLMFENYRGRWKF